VVLNGDYVLGRLRACDDDSDESERRDEERLNERITAP
jgi:hypothetical protein